MLPIPFQKYIPSFFNRDKKLIALSDKINSDLLDWKKDILNLNTMIDPLRMPSFLLNEIGNYLSAGILNTDSGRTKRQKIKNAISTHKNRGTWLFDIKPTIDSMSGGDSQLFGSPDSSDFIVLGQESEDPDYYWGTIGIDGIDNDLGIDIIGDGNEVVLSGVFQIDIDSSIADIPALKLALKDKIPIYYRVFLGYLVSGAFIPFPDGQIN